MNPIRFFSQQKIFNRMGGFKLMEFYPPFLFMGVRIEEVSPDFRHLKASLPARWYGSNPHGTIFGGFMAALADPLPALLCAKIIPDTKCWTQAMNIYFKRPGKGRITLIVTVSEENVRSMREHLEAHGHCREMIHCRFEDQAGKLVAEIQNTVYLSKKTSAD